MHCLPSLPPDLIPEKIEVSGYDFSGFTERGFFFTPLEYKGDYQSIGLIQLTYRPEARFVEVVLGAQLKAGEYYGMKKWELDQVDPEKVLEELYNVCIEMGADALTQMQFTWFDETFAQGTQEPVVIGSLRISGFAIKRLGAFK